MILYILCSILQFCKRYESFYCKRPQLIDVIINQLSIIFLYLQSYNGQPFDPQGPLATNSSNIICRLIFGHRFEHNDPEFHQLMNYLRGIMGFRAEGEVMVFPFLQHAYIYKERWQKNHVSVLNMFKYFGGKIDEHKSRLSNSTASNQEHEVLDFIDAYLLHAVKDPVHFNDEELKVLLSDLFIAGSDTVSTTLCWAILYMAAHPDIQEEVQAEIQEVMGQEIAFFLNMRLLMFIII